MRLRFRLTNENVLSLLQQDDILRGLRPVYFQHKVRQLPEFEFDSFKADWVIECFMTLLAETLAAGSSASVVSALRVMGTAQGMDRLVDIPASLFQPDANNVNGGDQALQLNLRELLIRPEIQQLLLDCADALWKPVDELEGFVDWARRYWRILWPLVSNRR
jgi:hypothetical protein